VNCRYHTSEKDFLYEFTLAFIQVIAEDQIFDAKTGKLVSIVKGWHSHPVNIREVAVEQKKIRKLQRIQGKKHI